MKNENKVEVEEEEDDEENDNKSEDDEDKDDSDDDSEEGSVGMDFSAMGAAKWLINRLSLCALFVYQIN